MEEGDSIAVSLENGVANIRESILMAAKRRWLDRMTSAFDEEVACCCVQLNWKDANISAEGAQFLCKSMVFYAAIYLFH